jgi:hypothetical protein
MVGKRLLEGSGSVPGPASTLATAAAANRAAPTKIQSVLPRPRRTGTFSLATPFGAGCHLLSRKFRLVHSVLARSSISTKLLGSAAVAAKRSGRWNRQVRACALGSFKLDYVDFI